MQRVYIPCADRDIPQIRETLLTINNGSVSQPAKVFAVRTDIPKRLAPATATRST